MGNLFTSSSIFNYSNLPLNNDGKVARRPQRRFTIEGFQPAVERWACYHYDQHAQAWLPAVLDQEDISRVASDSQEHLTICSYNLWFDKFAMRERTNGLIEMLQTEHVNVVGDS